MKEKVLKYKFDDLFNPTLQALHNLGGSGSVDEIEDEVAKILNLTEEDELNALYKGTITRLSYRLGWTRNYLKGFGLLENSSRGVWALTEAGLKTKEVNKTEVKRFVRQKRKSESVLTGSEEVEANLEIDEEIQELTWQESLVELLKKIDPIAFERLCQRFLRELGFQNVEVTQRSNDGGIDGVGILKIGSVISFRCVFQAKRYKNTVSSDIIRDFRGAMIGRGDRGVIITTGTFTREAKKEAIRDGAPPIDLIDGNELAEKLKELNLGVEVEMVEKVNIKTEWFKSI